MSEFRENAVPAGASNIDVSEPSWGRALLGFILSTTAACTLLVLLQGT